MELLLYCVIGFAPAWLWLWFLRHKDDLEPEPRRLMLVVFALGCGSAFATLELRPYLETWLLPELSPWRDLVDAFAVTAAAEESLKLLAFFLGAFWHRELDEPMDGIVYGASAGLGFASVENVFYLLGTGAPELIAARAFTATLAHVACSGGLGFFVGMLRMRRRTRKRWLLLAGLSSAVLLHGTYDWFLFATERMAWVSLGLALPLMAVVLGLQIRWARARSPEYHGARA